MPEPAPFPREIQPAPHLEHLELGPEAPLKPRGPDTETRRTPQPAPAAELPATVPLQPVAPSPNQSAVTKQVEQVLASGLDDAFRQLDAPTQTRFKQVGEETAVAITGLLEEVKVQTKKIIDLIVAWLKIIPGVNRFFLEQEAKIKTDQLLALRQHPPQK